MTFIDYSKEFYCSFCGVKFKRGEEAYDVNGVARCPRCGKPLRYKRRHK